MASYRQIHTKIWKDGWFLDLPPDNKLLFIYLFSNERANLIGLYDLPLRVVAFETGLELESVEWGMEQLEKAGKVYYENGWVWVTNLLRYNATNIDSPKIKTHIENTLDEIPDCQLKRRLIAYYAPVIPYIYGMKHNRTEQEHEQDTEQEQEQEMNNNKELDAVVVALESVNMAQIDTVIKEAKLSAQQIVETCAYAREKELGAAWVRKQLRNGTAYKPKVPTDYWRSFVEART